MKHNIYIALALVLSACTSSNNTEPQPPQETTGCVVLGAASAADMCLQWQAEPRSRTSVYPVAPAQPQMIGAWGYNDATSSAEGAGEVFCNVPMYHIERPLFLSMQTDPSSWAYNLDWEYPNNWAYENLKTWISSSNYKFAVYTPYTDFYDLSSDSITVNSRTYADFSTLTRRHIPRCTRRDFMFAAEMVAYRSRTSGNPVQQLQLMHPQSRLRLCFRLGDKYSDLRYIVLHKVEILDNEGPVYTLDAIYNASDDGAGTITYPVTTRWTAETQSNGNPITTSEIITLANDDDLTELVLDKSNRNYRPMASTYVSPAHDLTDLIVQVTYDVYDNTGQLLRRDETASNTITLNLHSQNYGGSASRKLLPGYYYDVNINIEPQFLYVLSDYDISADGFIVINP